MFGSIKRLLYHCIGSVEDTLLRARIFHAVSIIAMMGLPIAIFVNFFVKVPLANYALVAAVILIAALFVLSRVFGRLRLSLVLFSIGINIFIAINYFINSGIQGPTLILFLLSFVFTFTFMPSRQIIYWMLFNVGNVGVLLIYEYINPHSIPYSYEERHDLFLDMATTYVSVVACIGAVLFFLIHNYELEKLRALKASQALKVANDSKTRLLSVLSHDLRSPLNSIAGYLETLNEFELSDEERHFLERNLLDETKGMQVMLHNLLSWTKAQMDEGAHVNFTKLNLSSTVNDCINLQQSAAGRKSIMVKTSVDPALEINADSVMLKMVIQNLLNNSIKFTPIGGEIQIFSRTVPGVVQLHISDNGIGIPVERQANLFTFHASSTYGTNHEKGVGLGLILCKEYTEMQKGRIQFTSQPGQGTTFILEFDC